MIQQSLQNALARRAIERSVVTLVTQALVQHEDPALHEASKPIGHTMPEDAARSLAAEMRFRVAHVEGGWRRVVPSPRPIALVEADEAAQLVAAGTIVIAAGGGGTPVYRDPALGLEGIDAVIDKDHAAAVLARSVDAELLLILTNVDGVYRNYGDPDARELLRVLHVEEAERLDGEGEFGRGSMGPKVEAAVAFVRGGGRRACIARLDHGLEAVAGSAGTSIVQ
jgi:carbamate kinase